MGHFILTFECRYQKVIVSNETVPVLSCVGVREPGGRHEQLAALRYKL
jgi:hypothetical protein